jgi:hypothetical protein
MKMNNISPYTSALRGHSNFTFEQAGYNYTAGRGEPNNDFCITPLSAIAIFNNGNFKAFHDCEF